MDHLARILPCPHCGGQATMDQIQMADGIAVRVICRRCRASSPRILVADLARASQRAARAWNSRPAPRGGL